jgi:hypothetical protein
MQGALEVALGGFGEQGHLMSMLRHPRSFCYNKRKTLR